MGWADQVAAALTKRRLTLAVAESCTGGLLGGRITAVPGSSTFFKGGVTAYANDVKIRVLQIDAGLLEAGGAVSAAVAEAMASGARRLLGADIGVGITGVAGPGGGTAAKPVGRVYVGISSAAATAARQYDFAGDREAVRQQACDAALRDVLESLNA